MLKIELGPWGGLTKAFSALETLGWLIRSFLFLLSLNIVCKKTAWQVGGVAVASSAPSGVEGLVLYKITFSIILLRVSIVSCR